MWALALTLLTCLSVDVSNPLLPGVVRFDDSESIYWLRAERPRVDDRATTAPEPVSPACTGDDTIVQAGSGPVSLLLEAEQHWLGRPRSVTTLARAGPTTDEDH